MVHGVALQRGLPAERVGMDGVAVAHRCRALGRHVAGDGASRAPYGLVARSRTDNSLLIELVLEIVITMV